MNVTYIQLSLSPKACVNNRVTVHSGENAKNVEILGDIKHFGHSVLSLF